LLAAHSARLLGGLLCGRCGEAERFTELGIASVGDEGLIVNKGSTIINSSIMLASGSLGSNRCR
ncbi:hypothetical protein ACFL2A_07570, partial [Thermodesulfobacteriota bacterium]